MTERKPLDEKDKGKLLDAIMAGSQPGSEIFEQYRTAIFVRSVEDLERSAGSLEQAIRDASDSSAKLGRGLFWLNVVLAVATAVGAFAALWAAFD